LEILTDLTGFEGSQGLDQPGKVLVVDGGEGA